MSLPDSTASAALDAEIIKPVFFIYLDIDGGQVRANTAGANVTPAGTGFSEMDGEEFIGVSAAFLDVSPVGFAPGGSKSVTVTLSGIPEVDAASLALINDPLNWRGRDAMIWRLIRNAANVAQGGYHRFYTGKMTGLKHMGSVREQAIQVTVESYLAAFSEASNRTYLDQERYDPGDLSARAAIAIGNGNYSGNIDGVPGSYTQGGGAWRQRIT